MTTVARPGTPFPHTHVLAHHRHESNYFTLDRPSQHSYTAQPIHFSPRMLPQRTPPSLLKRASSTGSTSSARSTPTLIAPTPRRESTSSLASSSSTVTSPAMPVTPLLDESPLAPHPTPLELPSPSISRGFALPPPEYNWTDKQLTEETAFDISYSSFDICPVPKRPVFKRRDTPRPTTTTLGSLRMSIAAVQRDEDGHRGKRRLTSMVDGGDWLVLEEGS